MWELFCTTLLLSSNVLLETYYYFTAAAPKMWSVLLDCIRIKKNFDIFRKLLKTYYLRKAYSDLV